VDLYVDTDNAIDWQESTAAATVTIRCATTRPGFSEEKFPIRAKDLYRRKGGRGLIRLLNVFHINPGNSVIHNQGTHDISVAITIGDTTFQDNCRFEIHGAGRR
jgi:hypothetical protein